MPTKLFVGNLPAGASNEDIQALFEQYGTITECAVLGSFGFVHMLNEHEARSAMNALNRFDLYGSQLRVELSTPTTQGKMKNAEAASVKIFVGNLKNGVTDTEVRDIFEQYGTVTEAVVIGGYGFVHMANSDEAKSAIQDLNGFKLGGQPISVELSTKDTQGKSKASDGLAQQFDRPRGGAGWGGFRGRGRGMASTRFDPYATHSGASGWIGRADPYSAGGVDMYAQNDPYRQSMLPAPPAVLRPGPPVAGASAAAGGGDEASFARDLLRLYTENPAAFDAYARDPVVRRSMKLDAQEQMMTTGYEETGLPMQREYYAEARVPQSRLANPMMVSAYGGGVPVSRRGGPGLGAVQRPVGQLMGYRPNQSQLYMSFE